MVLLCACIYGLRYVVGDDGGGGGGRRRLDTDTSTWLRVAHYFGGGVPMLPKGGKIENIRGEPDSPRLRALLVRLDLIFHKIFTDSGCR